MSVLTIQAGGLAVQGPNEIRVYQFDWGEKNLPAGVEISGAPVWTLTLISPIGAALMTKDQESLVTGNRKAQVRLQGGVVGARYLVACQILTNETPPATKQQSFTIVVQVR